MYINFSSLFLIFCLGTRESNTKKTPPAFPLCTDNGIHSVGSHVRGCCCVPWLEIGLDHLCMRLCSSGYLHRTLGNVQLSSSEAVYTVTAHGSGCCNKYPQQLWVSRWNGTGEISESSVTHLGTHSR